MEDSYTVTRDKCVSMKSGLEGRNNTISSVILFGLTDPSQ